MATLEIEIGPTEARQLVAALDDYATSHGAALYDILYSSGDDLCTIAGDVASLRFLERAAADRDLTGPEMDTLAKARASSIQWLHRKAGEILCALAEPLRDTVAVCDASEVAGPDLSTNPPLALSELHSLTQSN